MRRTVETSFFTREDEKVERPYIIGSQILILGEVHAVNIYFSSLYTLDIGAHMSTNLIIYIAFCVPISMIQIEFQELVKFLYLSNASSC